MPFEKLFFQEEPAHLKAMSIDYDSLEMVEVQIQIKNNDGGRDAENGSSTFIRG